MIAELMLSLRRTGLPTVVVMIDDSASMGIVDRYDDDKLRAIVDKQLKQAGLEELTRLNLAKSVLLAGNDGQLLAGHRRAATSSKSISVAGRRRGSAGRCGRASGGGKRSVSSQPTGESSRLGDDVRAAC